MKKVAKAAPVRQRTVLTIDPALHAEVLKHAKAEGRFLQYVSNQVVAAGLKQIKGSK